MKKDFLETISIEDFGHTKVKVRLVEPGSTEQSAFTHYLYNNKNGISAKYRKSAINHVKKSLQYKLSEEKITNEVAESALQYVITNFKCEVPFPEPKKPNFTFIDLFAGIGGFRIAMQNLGGKCVFSSEWDKYSQKTYEANFGEIPFGDITKEETKSFIPNQFDVLCAGFPCQVF